MRDILFRGKRLDNGEWVYGSLLQVECEDGSIVTAIFDRKDSGGDAEVHPSTVGQFTGLLDKNGKRIFEGDICRNTKTNKIASVHWHGSMAGFVWNQKRDGSEYLYDFGALFRAHDKYEVIGNIHDNTEILWGDIDE